MVLLLTHFQFITGKVSVISKTIHKYCMKTKIDILTSRWKMDNILAV